MRKAPDPEAQGTSALSTHHLHRDTCTCVLTSGKLEIRCGASASAAAEKPRLPGLCPGTAGSHPDLTQVYLTG